MKLSRLALIGIATSLLIGGTYLILSKESPAEKYIKASCDEIRSSALSKGVESNERLLKKLEFNLDLAETADKEQTLKLSLYVDDLKSYIDFKKQSEAALKRNFELDLALGILGNRDTDEILDGATQDLREQGKIDSAQLDQKVIRLKNAYKEICEN